MIELLEISFHNYKIHRDVTFAFGPGVTGIVGDNGSGKSSLISGISFLFTGEYDTSRKAECITLGETEGWLSGKFRLNGKEGGLERHLTGSKVKLVYDGVTYNKFTEVNDVWNELLQIDTTIFNNVIVAKQGEIQNLFSDESSVREKIFQKIFMVPPTEKIRSVIWDSYIKTCPPEKPEEDVQLLQAAQASTAKERNRILNEANTLETAQPTPALLKCLQDRVSFLEKCKLDEVKRPEILNKIHIAGEVCKDVDIKLAQVDNNIESLGDIKELRDTRNRLLSIKPVYERRMSVEDEIKRLSVAVDRTRVTELATEASAIDMRKAEVLAEMSFKIAQIKDAVEKQAHFSQLKGHKNCPMCTQAIEDVGKFLESQASAEKLCRDQLHLANVEHIRLSKESQSTWSAVTKGQSIIQRIDYLQEELSKIDTVVFSHQDFNQVTEYIAIIEQLEQTKQQLITSKTNASAELMVLNEKLANLSAYDGNATAEIELTTYQQVVDANTRDKESIAELQLAAGKLEHELLLLDERVEASGKNKAYNTKRKDYLDRLTSAHELFSVSKFPRKLIETYMSNVQASLTNYLEYFSLPYSVRVVDGFKIRLYNENNEMLPMVSGGQEMMVGICLRLALHKMFAQSFNIWIVDEGTTHLSESKKESYFGLIDELRKQKIINQIIIIDHDERLGSVVDQVIQL